MKIQFLSNVQEGSERDKVLLEHKELLFVCLSSVEAEIWALRLGPGPLSRDLDLETKILASRLGSGSPGHDLRLGFRHGFGPRDWNLGLETGI